MIQPVLDPLTAVLAAFGAPGGIPAFEAFAEETKGIVIFGCGHLGRLALEGATGAGLKVLAFADNNRANWGLCIAGIEVLSPQEAVRKYNDDAYFVAAIYNGAAPRRQLAELNCKRIVPYPLFFFWFAQYMPSEDRLELPHRVIADPPAIEAGYALLSDERSRREFVAQIQWRCTLDYGCLPTPDPPGGMYYPADLFRLSEQEVLADCGAFDGDSIRTFLEKTGQRFQRIYALEPDNKNRGALNRYLATLPCDVASRIDVQPFGLSDRTEVVSFDERGTVGSRVVDGAGSRSIRCRRLDDILSDPPPTLIKMDIEGAEPKAIAGAGVTIRAARPVLAICAYHKCEHLWTLPVLIKNALPNCRIFLRRYAEECWETVYYAIPPERRLRPSVV